MNHWHLDALAEATRKEVLRELDIIRREEPPARANIRPARWYANTMYGLGVWMIDTGKQLRRRYEVPAVGCSRLPSPTVTHAR